MPLRTTRIALGLPFFKRVDNGLRWRVGCQYIDHDLAVGGDLDSGNPEASVDGASGARHVGLLECRCCTAHAVHVSGTKATALMTGESMPSLSVVAAPVSTLCGRGMGMRKGPADSRETLQAAGQCRQED